MGRKQRFNDKARTQPATHKPVDTTAALSVLSDEIRQKVEEEGGTCDRAASYY
jgi:hypothetical protein